MIMMMMSSPVPDLFSVGSESALFFITEMCLCRDEADITEKGPAGDSTGERLAATVGGGSRHTFGIFSAEYSCFPYRSALFFCLGDACTLSFLD